MASAAERAVKALMGLNVKTAGEMAELLRAEDPEWAATVARKLAAPLASATTSTYTSEVKRG